MISYIGIPLSVCWLRTFHEFFNVPMAAVFHQSAAVFLLSVICANSMALTSWTPTGALSKITQISMGAIDSSQPGQQHDSGRYDCRSGIECINYLPRVTRAMRETSSAGDWPRHRYFLRRDRLYADLLPAVPACRMRRVCALPQASFLTSSRSHAAMQWKGMAELIAKGVSSLPASAIIAMVVAAIAAVVIEVSRIVTKGKFPLSAVSIGLGVVLPPDACLAMWIGAALFWWMGRKHPDPKSSGHQFWVKVASLSVPA
jgi:ABC-type amino acid transport system permease subunit